MNYIHYILQQRILLTILIMTGTVSIMGQAAIEGFDDSFYNFGVALISFIRAGLGVISVIGAFGFFITTSPRAAHWPAYCKRIFFSLFIFCNITTQLIFNVFNVPSNKHMVCFLGRCVSSLKPSIERVQ